jgi:hypothetical protein
MKVKGWSCPDHIPCPQIELMLFLKCCFNDLFILYFNYWQYDDSSSDQQKRYFARVCEACEMQQVWLTEAKSAQR